MIVAAISIYISLRLGGPYGVALSAVGMLATLGITLATDAYGPVADNAGGLAYGLWIDDAHVPHIRDQPFYSMKSVPRRDGVG